MHLSHNLKAFKSPHTRLGSASGFRTRLQHLPVPTVSASPVLALSPLLAPTSLAIVGAPKVNSAPNHLLYPPFEGGSRFTNCPAFTRLRWRSSCSEQFLKCRLLKGLFGLRPSAMSLITFHFPVYLTDLGCLASGGSCTYKPFLYARTRKQRQEIHLDSTVLWVVPRSCGQF